MIFEPIWNNNYIDNIQITAAESIGVEHRAGYYETSGLLRDMFQNHMLTLLSLVAMEPPYSFESESIRNEKLKVLSSIRPITAKTIDKNFVRAQYTENNDENMVAYREEENVDPNSQTETYVAGTFFIDNWRWKDVPFLVRSGKRLKKRFTEIVITFKQVPHLIFGKMVEANLAPNKLRIKIQPDEAVCVTFNAKKPGPKLCMGHLEMDFKYSDVFGGETMDAYSRLILDAIQGDQTLFIRSDFILKSWELLTPVLQHWETGTTDLKFYESNSWGPKVADELANKFNTKWYND
jgi:glucose-6-phosphate 1-dehydrogenase